MTGRKASYPSKYTSANIIIDKQDMEIFDKNTKRIIFRKFCNRLGWKQLDNLTKSTDQLIEAYPP